MVETVVVLAQDLIWADRLVRACTAAGATATAVADAAALDAALARLDAGFVVVDLTVRGGDPFLAIERSAAAGAHVLAVGQHDDVEQRKRALAAGADRVLAYRKLFEDGPATIARWMAAGAPGSAAEAPPSSVSQAR